MNEVVATTASGFGVLLSRIPSFTTSLLGHFSKKHILSLTSLSVEGFSSASGTRERERERARERLSPLIVRFARCVPLSLFGTSKTVLIEFSSFHRLSLFRFPTVGV